MSFEKRGRAALAERRGRSGGAAAFVAAALLGANSGCAVTPSRNHLADLVDRHTAAMGGRQAIEAITSVEYRLRIVEPTFAVDGVYSADRSGRMRIDIYADGERVYTEAHDGRGAWQMGADGKATASTALGAAALWHGTQFPGKLLGLHEMAEHGHRLEFVGEERHDGILYPVIRLTLRDGFTSYLYFNPETWLLERQRDERALHPDVDPRQKLLENRFTDYRQLQGMMRSYGGSQVDIGSGATLQTSTVTGLRVNVALEDELFRFGSQPPSYSNLPSAGG
jgi:hypothetical protein